MSSQVDIANQALMMLGASPIVSFMDESVEAEAVRVLYNPAKQQILRSYDWNCASKSATLALLSDPPIDPKWKFRFSLPDDCIRVLEIFQATSGTGAMWGDFSVETGTLLARIDNVACRYIYDVEEPDLDPHVEMAFVARLAVDLSYPLTASSSREGNLVEIAERKLDEARTTDSQERTSKHIQINTLQHARM